MTRRAADANALEHAIFHTQTNTVLESVWNDENGEVGLGFYGIELSFVIYYIIYMI